MVGVVKVRHYGLSGAAVRGKRRRAKKCCWNCSDLLEEKKDIIKINQQDLAENYSALHKQKPAHWQQENMSYNKI